MKRIAMIARLKSDARDRADQLAMRDPTTVPGLDRISVFVSGEDVVFLLEGDAPDESYRMWLDDPVNSTLLEPWLPLFDGPLHRAPEIASWQLG